MSDDWMELEEWLDRWENEVLDGQTRISREEAIRRYYEWYKEDEDE